MKVFISAFEASADHHGAELLKALRKAVPPQENIQAFGAGGAALRAQGFHAIVRSEEMRVMGLVGVLSKLPQIFRAMRALVAAVASEKPDVVVMIDYPGFHLRLAQKLKKFRVPLVYFIPPKVWVWRKKRIHKIAALFKKVLCLLPFEVPLYRTAGVDAGFVGNPIVDELPKNLDRSSARAQLGITDRQKVLVFMPGSREHELKMFLPIGVQGILAAAEKLGSFQVLIPLPPEEDVGRVEALLAPLIQARSGAVSFKVSAGDAHVCLVAADVGIIKSGTSTLEAGLLGCPHSIVYTGSAIENWVFQNILRYEGPVGLVNLVTLDNPPHRVDRKDLPFREILMEQFTPQAVQAEVESLFLDAGRREQIHQAIQKVRERILSQSDSVSEKVAREIIEIAEKAEPSQLQQQTGRKIFAAHRMADHAVSTVWATVNALVRRLKVMGWIKPEKLAARVVSVGNIQAGGGGKTPLVIQIAREALERGHTVCVLLRGYGGQWERKGGVIAPHSVQVRTQESGDEAALIQQSLPAAWIAVGANRVEQFKRAQKQLGRSFDLVVLDDGFQNWKIAKDLEIVALTTPPAKTRLFRDWKNSLRFADLIVWTKGEERPVALARPFSHVKYKLAQPEGSNKVFLVTGVADGESVRRTFEENGWKPVRHTVFPDHARYAPAMVRAMLSSAKELGIPVAITGKDAVKWREILSADEMSSIVVVEPKLEWLEGKATWSQILWQE